MIEGCCSLGLLVRKIADARLQDISESLCKRVTNASGKKSEQRDIASIGLKTVISEVSGSQAQALVSSTTPLLIMGLNEPVCQVCSACMYAGLASYHLLHKCCGLLQANLDVLSDTLDVTSDLLARFGNVMSGYHSHLKTAILLHLEEPRPVVRKRAIQSMGKHAANRHLQSILHVHQCAFITCAYVHIVFSGCTVYMCWHINTVMNRNESCSEHAVMRSMVQICSRAHQPGGNQLLLYIPTVPNYLGPGLQHVS